VIGVLGQPGAAERIFIALDRAGSVNLSDN